ncbi:hypothetical protein [Mesorhizobium sp. BR-1-1-10]|uniref:hypothetical protein n=1 Tax=Mesorhizobium sp. BR-1-1-10 TaxID=2876660 RepID=UPI001CD04F94|nr:hypothetical protein [Mesorhizobium sp. BR-1-1-10]MBZ9975460.1 hypothetical protein [Mesorhizobium sp. BR-1-1-10]
MTYHQPPLWISDAEVRAIFARTTCSYKHGYGRRAKVAQGIFMREKRANDGTLGYVLHNPIGKVNWLWIIGKRDRRPFAVCVVS